MLFQKDGSPGQQLSDEHCSMIEPRFCNNGCCKDVGGDWGSFISFFLGAKHADHCQAIHTNLPYASPKIWRPLHAAQAANGLIPFLNKVSMPMDAAKSGCAFQQHGKWHARGMLNGSAGDSAGHLVSTFKFRVYVAQHAQADTASFPWAISLPQSSDTRIQNGLQEPST